MKHYDKFYIDGQWVEPLTSRKTFDLVNPATEETFATVSLGGTDDVDRAVRAARAAFPVFSATSKADRVALLQQIVQALRLYQHAADVGKVAAESSGPEAAQLTDVAQGLFDDAQTMMTQGWSSFLSALSAGGVVDPPENAGIPGLPTGS